MFLENSVVFMCLDLHKGTLTVPEVIKNFLQVSERIVSSAHVRNKDRN